MINTFYNLSISKKLFLFAIVPALTILAFSYDIISSKNLAHKQYKVTHDFILTSEILIDIVFELQKERGLDSAVNQNKITSNAAVSLTNQQRQTDDAISHYFDFMSSIKSSPKNWKRENEFEHFERELNSLLDIRLRDRDNNGFNLYSELIDSILSIIESLQTSSSNALLVNQISTYSTLLWLQEYTAQERGLIYGIFSDGKVTLLQTHTVNSIIEKQQQLLHYFNSIASNELRNKMQEQFEAPLNREVRDLKTVILNRAERTELLNRLHIFFGYGGMIHSYKNYLLRSKPHYLSQFNFVSKEALLVIQQMKRLKGITNTELNHLDSIQSIINLYIKNMELLKSLKKDGLSIKQIDVQIQINDFPALRALTALYEGEIKINPNVWWDKTSQHILTLDAFSKTLKNKISRLSEQNVHDAKNHLDIIVTLTSLALIILLALGYIILRRLVFDMTDIANEMDHMVSSENYNNKLSVSGNDEIGIMAKSFNALLNKINNSQKQLMGQMSAMNEHSIVATTDLKGTLTYVNKKFCDISGYTEKELIGSNHRIFNSGNQTKEYWRKMFAAISKGDVWHDEVLNIAKDGHQYWVDTTILPISWNSYDINSSNNNQEHKGYIAIRTDISKRKHQEQTLFDAKIAAEAATVAKSQFLATMSHEIRTPMNGVIGMAQLLEDTPLNDEQQDYVSTITHSGNSLLSIINDILDFSKLDADMVEMESIPFNLENLCQETLILMASNNKDLEIIFDYAPDCPRYFMGDPSRLRQVLLNFLSNSIKFTKQGFVRLGVSSSQNKSNATTLTFDIQDTGIGLRPEAIKTLFDEFTQADSSTTREFGGTGLGLAITKKIVHLMGGEISVKSVYGEGSTFSINCSMPLSKDPEHKIIHTTSLEGIRILFVDDHQENLKIFNRLLNHMGAITTVLDNPLDTEAMALNAIEEGHPFQIIILDHNMPNISGKDLGIQLRNNPKLSDTKLLIFSSVGEKGDAATFSQIGFNAYLNKLSRYDTLKSILSAMLSHQQGRPLITQYSVKESLDNPGLQQLKFKGRILLVEDVLPNLIIAQKFLTKMGLAVDTAVNGQEAIDAVNKNAYDLVFMDCRMPVMDGYAATEIIRQQEAKLISIHRLPIVALTANVSQEDKLHCQQAGMDDLITKPFKRTDLSSCLLQWLTPISEKNQNMLKTQKISTSEKHILDKGVYNQLKNDMGEDFKIIEESIFDSISSNIELLENSDKNTSTKDLIRFAHSIKSPAANLGMTEVAQLAQVLESQLVDEHRHLLPQAIDELKDALNAVKEALNQLQS